MHSVRLRNGRMKTVLYTCLILAVLLLIYYIGDSHVRLEAIKSLSGRCEQQRESLSAQMQVLFEHKARLEKFLKQEEEGAKKIKEEMQERHKELKTSMDKELQDANEKLRNAEHQHQSLSVQHKELEDEYEKLKQRMDELSSAQHELKKKSHAEFEQLRAVKDLEIQRLQKLVYKKTLEEDTQRMETSANLKKISDLERELAGCKQVLVLQDTPQQGETNLGVEKQQQQQDDEINYVGKPPKLADPNSSSSTTTTTTPSSPLMNAELNVAGGENKKTLDKPFNQGNNKAPPPPLEETKKTLDIPFSHGVIEVVDSPVQIQPMRKPDNFNQINNNNVVNSNNVNMETRPLPKPKEAVEFPRIQDPRLLQQQQQMVPPIQGAMEAPNNAAEQGEEEAINNNVIRPPNAAPNKHN